MPIVNRLPHRIAFERRYVISILRGIRQRALPQAFGIAGLFPDAVVAFVDGALQGNTGALKGADLVAEIHEKSRVRWKLTQQVSEFALELIAGAHVDLSFLQADRTGAPDIRVAGDDQSEHGDDAAEAEASIPRVENDPDKNREGGRKCREQMQSVAHVVMRERPPVGNENGNAAVGNGERVKRHSHEQEQ